MDTDQLPEPMVLSNFVIYTNKTCLICHKGIDELNLGELHDLQVFSVHYLCLVTGVDLYPTGKNEGLLGFLLADIYKAYKNYKNNICTYCLKFGASLQCNFCKKKFHLPCGIKTGIQIEMVASYPSTCKSCSDYFLPESAKNIKTYSCSICLGPPSEGSDKLYWPVCCKPECMIHFDCLQLYAFTAGYLTKCPLCSNTAKFRASIKKFGIYIPNQDAIWLKEEAENVVSYPLKCCAKVCILNADSQISTVLTECLVCQASIAHEECTFCGIFVCCDCTEDLWPDGVEEKELADETEILGIIFPWFFYLIGTLKHGRTLLRVVTNVLKLVGKTPEGKRVKWNELLDDNDTKLIRNKMMDCRNDYLEKKK